MDLVELDEAGVTFTTVEALLLCSFSQLAWSRTQRALGEGELAAKWQ